MVSLSHICFLRLVETCLTQHSDSSPSPDLAGTITLPRKLVRICLDLPISTATDPSASTGLISAVLLYNAAELQSMPAGDQDRQGAVDLFMATWVALGAKLLANGEPDRLYLRSSSSDALC